MVNALATATRIDIYGVGASGFVALDLQQKLQRIGRPAFAWPDPHMAITSAALRGAGDVAVGLSHTGTTVDTIDALREARAHGATTVAVTNFPWSPITEVADFVLLTAARETAFRSGAMTSRIAQLTVVDCLFVVLAQRDLPATKAALERTYAAAQAKRTRRARRAAPAPPSERPAPPGGRPCPGPGSRPARRHDPPPPGPGSRPARRHDPRPGPGLPPRPAARPPPPPATRTAPRPATRPPPHQRLSGRCWADFGGSAPFGLLVLRFRVPSIAVSSAPAQLVTEPTPPESVPAAAKGRRLAWLDALRGFAALCVVFDHMSTLVLQHVRSDVYVWFNGGQYGVFVFFLVSGYIIPASLERKGSVRGFWVSRAFRLYPLYIVGIAVLAPGLEDRLRPDPRRGQPAQDLGVLTAVHDVQHDRRR